MPRHYQTPQEADFINQFLAELGRLQPGFDRAVAMAWALMVIDTVVDRPSPAAAAAMFVSQEGAL